MYKFIVLNRSVELLNLLYIINYYKLLLIDKLINLLKINLNK